MVAAGIRRTLAGSFRPVSWGNFGPLTWTDYVSGVDEIGRTGARRADDKRASLADAVAQHVRAGDVLHPVVGHTRWSAATREIVRQWWGRDPQFTLVMLSLSSLGALFFRGHLVRKVVTGYSGDTFPNFTPNPVFARAYERGEVEVEHWSFLAFAQRLEAGARGLPAIVDAFDRGFVDGAERRLRARRHAVRRGGPAVAVAARRRDPARAGRRPGRQRRVAAAAARRRVGLPRRPAGHDRDRRADRRRHPAVGAPRADPGPPGAGGRGVPDGRPPGRVLHGRAARRRLRRGLRLLGRRARRDPRRRLRRVDRALGARASRRRSSGSSSWAASASPRCAPRPRPTRGTPTRPRSRPTSRARSTRGSAPRCGVRAISPSACSRSTPTRCSRGPVSRISPRGSACSSRATAGSRRAAHRGDRVVGVRRDARGSLRVEPPQLPDRDDARRRGDGARRARRRRGHDDARVSRRRAGRSLRKRELDAHRPQARSSSDRAAATTSRAPRPRTSSSRR